MQRDYWPTAEWQAAAPDNLGMCVEKLARLEPVIQSEYSNINGIVVVKNGYVVFEKYYNGYGPDDTHHVASVTKSVLSAVVGAAIDNGYIENVDQKVLDFFPEYTPDAADQQKGEVTLRHLLTMTASFPFENWREPLDKMCMQPDWVKYALHMLGQKGSTRTVEGSAGYFKYSTAGAHLLSAIITRATGRSARVFANEQIFKKVGMKEIADVEMKSFGFDDLFGRNVRGWVEDPSGNSAGGWGLTLTPRDMARFGFLYLNDGVWDNKRIIPEKWVVESTCPHAEVQIGEEDSAASHADSRKDNDETIASQAEARKVESTASRTESRVGEEDSAASHADSRKGNDETIASQAEARKVESTAPRTESRAAGAIAKYGYLWWLREEDGVFAYLALGDGGNVICCIPEKDLVVAVASEFIMNSRDRWMLIKEWIIPAVLDVR